ncbi:ATP-binding cassette domain-containing protein, partial [Cohnella lubricantis]
TFMSMRLESRIDMNVQAAVWDRLLRLPAAFFRGYSAGDLAMRANSINAIRSQLSGIVLGTLFSGLFSSFNLLLLFRYDAGIALIGLGLVAFGILVSAAFSLIQLRYQRKLMQNQGKLSSLMLQLLSGIAKFRIAAAESRAFYLWANLFGMMNRIGYKSNKLQSYFAVYQAIFPVVTSMVLYYAVASMGEGRMSAGGFIAFFSAFSAFLAAMLSMSSSLLSVMGVVTLYERAKPILEALPEEAGGGEHPGRLSGQLELNGVHFRYESQSDWVLRDVSLTVKPGEMLAIVGESGSGKSTLIRLLLGFEQPESGMVRFDGRELGALDVQAVRRQIGVVMQQADVMAGSLYENIVGSAGLPLEAAWEAAAMAGLAKDILAMPMGMHTMIPDGGGTLSGGQRQRLMIARAIVRKPKVLIFDEATSALDNRTQAEVSASLEKLQATRIVIAHRLSTVRHADRILVIRKGTIVESGTYDELIAASGEFARMAERQAV